MKQPSLHSWTDEPLRLIEQSVAYGDPGPKALACYGLLLHAIDELWLKFVDGRPVSAITNAFLADCCTRLAARRERALVLIWDNASWHISKAVTAWIREHNQHVKREGNGVRIIACRLAVKAPWLNPIEPKGVHESVVRHSSRSCCCCRRRSECPAPREEPSSACQHYVNPIASNTKRSHRRRARQLGHF